ncbi:MAG TPA: penicillin acylase family protein, partial [Verrucomicrobiae bacterium]|nr:penicillin acylase family protein [Verrucomicrobiae bacterium]
DLARVYGTVPYSALPSVAASRDAIVWTANNKMYAGHPALRLSAQFAPPYRAYRIAQLLRARTRYDAAYFTGMQMDVLSLPERELARELVAHGAAGDAAASSLLARWDGRMSGGSVAATIVERWRLALTAGHNGRLPSVLFASRRGARFALPAIASPQPWAVAGAIPVTHALASLGITMLDGTTFPGNGDAFTLHMQSLAKSGADSQSFRAVWDVGNWDAGGISLPQGESGEPGSGHYTDQAADWIAGRLLPLPFSAAAVDRAAAHRLVLAP